MATTFWKMVQTSNSRKLTQKMAPKLKTQSKSGVFFSILWCQKIAIFSHKIAKLFIFTTQKKNSQLFLQTKATKFVSKRKSCNVTTFFGKNKLIILEKKREFASGWWKTTSENSRQKQNTASKPPKQCNKANKCSVTKVLHALKSKAACKEFEQSN